MMMPSIAEITAKVSAIAFNRLANMGDETATVVGELNRLIP
jgi:hypothetical protein